MSKKRKTRKTPKVPSIVAGNLDVVILSGPSGSGKSTLVGLVQKWHSGVFSVVVSDTTRAPRPGESNGVHYNFISEREFMQRTEMDWYYETNRPYGTYAYGTPRAAVDQLLYDKKKLFFDVDYIGSGHLREELSKVFPNIRILSVGVITESVQQSADRLIERNRQSKQPMTDVDLVSRIARAEEERNAILKKESGFKVIINVAGKQQQAAKKLIRLLRE